MRHSRSLPASTAFYVSRPTRMCFMDKTLYNRPTERWVHVSLFLSSGNKQGEDGMSVDLSHGTCQKIAREGKCRTLFHINYYYLPAARLTFPCHFLQKIIYIHILVWYVQVRNLAYISTQRNTTELWRTLKETLFIASCSLK